MSCVVFRRMARRNPATPVLIMALLIVGSVRGEAPAKDQVCMDGETGPHCSGGAGAGTALELNPYELEDFVVNYPAVVVVFCSASAGKCRLLAPEIKKAAESTASGFIPRPKAGLLRLSSWGGERDFPKHCSLREFLKHLDHTH